MFAFRNATVVLVILLWVADGAAGDLKPRAPTKEELEAANVAAAKLGGSVANFPVKLSLKWDGDAESASAWITTLRFEAATDETLAGLPVIPFPFGLVVNSPKLTDPGVKSLAKQKNLRQLDLSFTKVTGGGLAALAGLPQIEALSVTNCAFTATGLGGLAKTKSLRYLRLLRANVGNDAMKEVGQLTSLRVLEMHGNRDITDAGVTALKGLTELTDLDMSGSMIKGETLDELQKATRLKLLDLRGASLTDKGLKQIGKLTGLKRLNVSFNQKVTDDGVKELKTLQGLEHLSLGVTAVSDRGLASVGSLNRLTYLSLFSTKVTDVGLKHLTGLKELQFLHWNLSKVTAAGVKELKTSLPKLGR